MSDGVKRYVVGFAFSPDEGTVLLLQKNRPAWQAGKLNGIGGHVEPGESFAAAMLREGQEEAGIDPGWELFCILSGTAHPKGSAEPWEMWCFRATTRDVYGLEGRLSDVGEQLTLAYVVDVTQGDLQTIPNLAWLLPMAQEARRHDWPYCVEERSSRGVQP